MADLSDIQAADTVKLVGANSSGVETNPVNADVNGNLNVTDYANGTPGAAVPPVAHQIAGSDGTDLRTVKVDAAGRILIDLFDGAGTAVILGQKLMAASLPVAIASDQSTLPIKNADIQYSGTISALNGVFQIPCAGMSDVTINLFNSWIASVTFSYSTDNGASFRPVNGIYMDGISIPISSTTIDGGFRIQCGGFTHIQLQVQSYTSGTIGITANASAGSNVGLTRLLDGSGNPLASSAVNSVQRLSVGLASEAVDGATAPFDTVQVGGKDGSGNLQAQAMDTNGNQQIVGSVPAGTTDSGNGVKVSGVFNTTLPTLTTGQRGDVQLDSNGRLIIAPLTNVSIVKAQLQDNAGNDLSSQAINSIQRLNVNLASEGVDGATAPFDTIQMGGKDSAGNLQAILTETTGEQYTKDIINVGGQGRAQSVTTTAAEALGGATILAKRKFIQIRPTNGIIYWGFTTGVTTATGMPIYTNEPVTFAFTDAVHIYLIAAQTTDVRIVEGA